MSDHADQHCAMATAIGSSNGNGCAAATATANDTNIERLLKCQRMEIDSKTKENLQLTRKCKMAKDNLQFMVQSKKKSWIQSSFFI